MATRPTVGGSDGTWGSELNAHLDVSLDTDGKVDDGAAQTTSAAPGADAELTNMKYVDDQVSAITQPNGAMYRNADQLNLVSGAPTKVALNAICANFVDGIEDIGNNAIAPLVPGFYLCIGQVTFTQVIADKMYELKMEGGPKTIEEFKHSRTTDNLTIRCIDVMYIEAAERLEMYAIQNSGANTVDIKGAGENAGFTFLTMQRVR